MKKKRLIPTLLLTTTLLLAACTSNEQQDIPSESMPTQENTLQESESIPPVESTQEEEKMDLPKVTISNTRDYRYTEDGTVLLAEAETDYVTLEGEGYEKAAQTLESLFTDNEETLDYLASLAREDAIYREGNGDYAVSYSSMSTCEIARLDRNVLSIKRWSYDYTGGAHGLGGYWGSTIDLNSGEELELIDLAIDSYGLISACSDYVLEQLAGRSDELFPEYETYIADNLKDCGWYLDASGIVFVFTPYEIAPYASGNIEVCVPYSHLDDCMKTEYCGLQGDCIVRIQTNSEVFFTTEGKTKELVFETRMLSEYDYSTFLIVDGEEVSVGDYVSLESAYLMHDEDGKTFLLYSIDWASDDYETYVYDLTGDMFLQTGNVWANLNGHKLSPDEFTMDFRLDVLGTYFAEMDYSIDSEGVLRPLEYVYEIGSNRAWSGLTTIRELPVIMNNEATTLPVGSRIYIIATDNDGTAWYETTDADGEIQSGLIRYIRDAESYRIYIDGIFEDEYFESLPYAG